MRARGILTVVLGVAAATTALCQIPPPAGKRTGPGVQAALDSKEPEVLKACKTPPPARAGRGPRRAGVQAPVEAGPRKATSTEIPGVIAAGQEWKQVWQVDGNNADGIIATKDGGILIAQNDNS